MSEFARAAGRRSSLVLKRRKFNVTRAAVLIIYYARLITSAYEGLGARASRALSVHEIRKAHIDSSKARFHRAKSVAKMTA